MIYDVLIDDGSHISEHVRIAFDALFSHMTSAAICVIEDLHTSYLAEFGGDSQRLRDAETSIVSVKGLLNSTHRTWRPGYMTGYVEAVCIHRKIAFDSRANQKFDRIRAS
jgi:hypothetical protein